DPSAETVERRLGRPQRAPRLVRGLLRFAEQPAMPVELVERVRLCLGRPGIVDVERVGAGFGHYSRAPVPRNRSPMPSPYFRLNHWSSVSSRPSLPRTFWFGLARSLSTAPGGMSAGELTAPVGAGAPR